MKSEATLLSPESQSDREENLGNTPVDADTSQNTSTDTSMTTDSNISMESDYNENSETCTLFVGDLASDVNESHLEAEFSRFGRIKRVEIKRDKATGLSLGYGFVLFDTRAQAIVAKLTLHRKLICGRRVRVGWAHKNSNLYVGGLDSKVTSEDLRKLFRPFGEIVEEETFVKRRYGFVRFKHRADAETAKNRLEGIFYFGQRLHLGWGDAFTQRYCAFFQFDAKDDLSELLTESDVYIRFCLFGEIESIHLPRDRQGAPKGYGFVRFPDNERGEISAAHAIREMNNNFIPLNSFRGSRGGVLKIGIRCDYGKHQVHRRRVPSTFQRSINNNNNNRALDLEPGYFNNEGLFIPNNNLYFLPPHSQYGPPSTFSTLNHNPPYIIDGRFAPLYLYPQPALSSQPSPSFFNSKQHFLPIYSGVPPNNNNHNDNNYYRGYRGHFAE